MANMVTNGEGVEESTLLPLGKYTVTEIIAPDGYVLDTNTYTVDLRSADHVTPVVTATVTSVNDPTEILLQKNDQNGGVLAGAEFGLFNADGYQVAAAISDEEGLVCFRLIPHGDYTIREISAPDGYLLNQSEISVSVTETWTNSDKPMATVVDQLKQIMFLKVNTSGNPMAGITFKLINA